ncbi:MAG TPA: HmuY family protein [Sphingobacterium sp.]|nr:HmuY family protein [Sphingobacterium sp.]
MKTKSLISTSIYLAQYFFPLVLSASLLLSCSKDSPSPDPDEELPTESGEMVDFYEVHRVENWYVKVNYDNSSEGLKEAYYSLEYNKERDRSYQKTDLWDISFSNMLNSFLGANNKSDESSFGFEGNGNGGILILEEAFEEVTDIPDDSDFLTGRDGIGIDGKSDFFVDRDVIGWYIYDWDGIILGDGSPDKTHTTYALGNPLELSDGSDAPIRTLVVRTAQGNYAKVKIISCYKDAETQEEMVKDAPKMYYTFEYMLVPAGSNSFEKE